MLLWIDLYTQNKNYKSQVCFLNTNNIYLLKINNMQNILCVFEILQYFFLYIGATLLYAGHTLVQAVCSHKMHKIQFTCSIICLIVFRRTTPEDFSEPASFGSVAARKNTVNITNMKQYTKYHFIQIYISELNTYWQLQTHLVSLRPASLLLHLQWDQTKLRVF